MAFTATALAFRRRGFKLLAPDADLSNFTMIGDMPQQADKFWICETPSNLRMQHLLDWQRPCHGLVLRRVYNLPHSVNIDCKGKRISMDMDMDIEIEIEIDIDIGNDIDLDDRQGEFPGI